MPIFLGSLRGKFIFWLAIVFALSLAIALAAFKGISEHIIVALGERFAEKQALYDKERIQLPLMKEITLARRMADSEQIQAWVQDEQNPELKKTALRELNQFRYYFHDGCYSLIVDHSGHYYFNDRYSNYDGQELRYTLDPKSPVDHWYFLTRKANYPYYVHVTTDQHMGLTKLWVDVPMNSAQGQRIGMFTTGINLDDFLDEFMRNSHDDGIRNILIDEKGVIKAHPDMLDGGDSLAHLSIQNQRNFSQLLPVEDDQMEFQAALDALRMVPTQVQVLFLNIEGQRKLVGIAYMPNLGWFNITEMNLSTLLGSNTFLPLLLVLVGILLLSLIGVAAVLQQFVLKRIVHFDRASRALAHGDYSQPLTMPENDELGRLARSFNSMAATIQANTEKLELRVAERTAELEQVNQQLARKNKQIIDSIRYARLIQNAILPRSDLLAQHLSDHLVLWIPRDVVGGDFYFLHPAAEQGCYLGLVDCTGHGIPGAFMTMTAHAIIRQVLKESSQIDLPAILALIDERLRQTLQHTREGDALDYGMDIALCHVTEQELTYAGCGIDLYVVDAEQGSSVIKATHRGLGYHRPTRKQKPIVSHTLTATPNQRFYLVSDGLLDQDGGDEGFGFGRERFLNLIGQWYDRPLNQQQAPLVEFIEAYRAERQQRDDITIFGFSCSRNVLDKDA
jgi:sigma-B regulation protein RsbU (phosphoserine phosphatase)